MKKQLLTSMIAVALLAGCDDKPADQATNKAAETAEKVVAVAKSNLSPAEQAEEQFKQVAKAGQKYYQTFVGAHPLVDSITYDVVSYEKGQDSATAITKGSVKLKTEIEGKKTFDLSLKHDIKYDAAVLASGLVAKVNSKIIKPEGLNEEENKFFDDLDKNFAYTTDISKDQSINQDMVLKPFNFESEENGTVTFNGINVNSKTTIKDIEGGFGKFVFDFKGIKDANGFGVEATNLVGEYQSNGDFTMNSTTPIVISTEEDNISIESITAKGNMKLNEKYSMMVGKANYEFKNIQFSNSEVPFPVSLKTVGVDVNTAINDKDILSQEMDMKLIPAEGLVSNLSQGMLDVSQADIHFDLDNIPANVMTDYNNMMAEMFQDMDIEAEAPAIDEEAMQAKLESMFESVRKTGGKIGYSLNVATDQGNIVLDGDTQMKSDSTVSLNEITESASPEALLQAIDLNVDASVPATLLEMIAGDNIIMVGMFMTKEGDAYKSKITTEEGQIMINGVPAPF